MLSDIEALVNGLAGEALATCQVDVSAFFDKPAGEIVWTYGDMSLPQLLEVARDAETAFTRYPALGRQASQLVAILAQTHLAPAATGSRIDIYATIAFKSRRLFLHILGQVNAAFPHLTNGLEAEAEVEKKD